MGEKNFTSNKKTIAALDIGATKVAVVIGEIESEKLNIIGVGQVEHFGICQGSVLNIDNTAKAILNAKEDAELMAGCSIDSIWLGVAGQYIQSFDSEGMVAIREKQVTYEDVQRVIETAKAIPLPSDHELLHVLPSSYTIDHQKGIQNPVGMSGVRLECSVRIITGLSAPIQNTVQCVESAGLKVNGLVLQSLAASMALLTEDEKQMGVSVIDIGGASCNIISYYQGKVVLTESIPVGGQNFTFDIAMGLKTTRLHAEELKKVYGSVLTQNVDPDEVIEVESVGGGQQRTVCRKELCEILEARAQETLELTRDALMRSGSWHSLGAGLVFTGGACQLKGFLEMGEFLFDLPLRIGYHHHAGGLKDMVKQPHFSTAVGLLLYALKEEKSVVIEKGPSLSSSVKGLFHQVKGFFGEL